MTVTNIDAAPEQAITMTGPIRVSTSTNLRLDGPVGLRFRGALQVRAGFQTTLMVINDISAAAYDVGVLAGQIPSTRGPKAQQAAVAGAVAVRSRAVASLTSPRAVFDVTADDPLYLGIDGERATTTSAVVVFGGKVLQHHKNVMNVGVVGIQPIMFAPSPGKADFVANGPATAIAGAKSKQSAAALARAKPMLRDRDVYGGDTPSGFDCSGLMYWIWHTNLGFAIARDANSQSKLGVPVQRNDLQPGDALLFADRSGDVTYVGLYIGNNMFLHAANSGRGVRIDSLTAIYYVHTYAGARRVSPLR